MTEGWNDVDVILGFAERWLDLHIGKAPDEWPVFESGLRWKEWPNDGPWYESASLESGVAWYEGRLVVYTYVHAPTITMEGRYDCLELWVRPVGVDA